MATATQDKIETISILSGGKWVEPGAGFDNAHIDGNLVTAPAWPAHPAFMRAFLKVLGTPVG